MRPRENAASRQKTCIELINHLLKHGMPIVPLSGLTSFKALERQVRNAEEALLAVLYACAAHAQIVSAIAWPDFTSFGTWMSRLAPQRADDEVRVALRCLGWLDLSDQSAFSRDFYGAYLSRANLSRANLYGANLSDANLSGANLSGTNLIDANISGTNLSGTYFSYTYLNGANLSRTHLNDANLSGAYLSDANLRGAHLYDANLRGTDLRGANLSGANLIDTDLSDANLSRADLSDANLSRADLSGADLSGADLSGADLLDADLIGAKHDATTIGWSEALMMASAADADSDDIEDGEAPVAEPPNR